MYGFVHGSQLVAMDSLVASHHLAIKPPLLMNIPETNSQIFDMEIFGFDHPLYILLFVVPYDLLKD